jgi:hypothetical protein
MLCEDLQQHHSAEVIGYAAVLWLLYYLVWCLSRPLDMLKNGDLGMTATLGCVTHPTPP